MLSVTPAEKSEITHIVCPYCKEKVARVGLDKTGHSLCCSHIARCFFGTPSGAFEVSVVRGWGEYLSQSMCGGRGIRFTHQFLTATPPKIAHPVC